ncbi:hypothetical protein MASR1M107_07360 [Ignavibacteriales bacterium]
MHEFLKNDSEMLNVLNLETKRQTEKLELIASENSVSPAVLAAAGSILTNKYAEGIRVKDITVDVSMWIWLKILPARDLKDYLVPSM